MLPTQLPTKVCCIQDEDEAAMAVRHGALALGLVSRMPSGWGPIPDQRIAEIARTAPAFVSTVLLTMLSDPAQVVAQNRICRCSALQLVDEFPLDGYAHLRAELPGVTILKAVHVLGPEAMDQAAELAPLVDGIILDTGAPHAEVKVLGGTGKTHDWSISARIAARFPGQVFLAGGLKPDNVAQAIRTVQPYGLDLCTGVRTDTRLDPSKLAAFFRAARG
jgi:phosphoribosylanthranilate isomerase